MNAAVSPCRFSHCLLQRHYWGAKVVNFKILHIVPSQSIIFIIAVSNLQSFSVVQLWLINSCFSTNTQNSSRLVHLFTCVHRSFQLRWYLHFSGFTRAHMLPLNLSFPLALLTPSPPLLPHFPTQPTAPPSLCECSAGMAGTTECRQSWAPGTRGLCHTGKINMPDWQLDISAFPQAQIWCCRTARYTVSEHRFWHPRWAYTYVWKQYCSWVEALIHCLTIL